MVHLTRVFGLYKELDMFFHLRLMVSSIRGGFMCFSWWPIIIDTSVIFFGLWFGDATMTYCVSHGKSTTDDPNQLHEHFGTLADSELSIYTYICQGAEWGEGYAMLSPFGKVSHSISSLHSKQWPTFLLTM